MFVDRRQKRNRVRCVNQYGTHGIHGIQSGLIFSLLLLALGNPSAAQAANASTPLSNASTRFTSFITAPAAQPHEAADWSPALAPPLQDTEPVTPTPVPFVPRAVKPLELPPGTVNIALLGIDTRPQFDYHNTDVIIIASINPDIPSVTLLSIPRDTYSYMPRRYLGKINQAWGIGGFELFTKTLMHNFGLKIDHYAMVNFQALVHSVDSFDGIDVVATCPIYHIFPRDPFYVGGLVVAKDYTDQFTGEVYPAGTLVPTQTIDIPKPGIYSLNGLQALAYVRARKGIPGGDVDRGRREIRVIRALFAKAKQLGTLAKIPELLAEFQNDIETDLTLPDLLAFAGMADRFDDTVIRSRFLDPGGANGQAVSDDALYNPNQSDNFWRQRRDYLQNTLTVSVNHKTNDSIPIEVVNGTSDAGFATAATDRLNELGFRVVNIRAASASQARTQIIDHTSTKKGSAVPLLLRTFGLRNDQVVADPQAEGVRYTIVVGPDFNTCYYAPTLQASGSTEIDTAAAPVDPLQVLPENIKVVAPLETPVPTAATASLDSRNTSVPVKTAQPTTRPALIPTPAAQAFVFVAGSTAINIRQTPSLEGAIIGSLASGEQAPIVGRSTDNEWFQIRTLQNGIGWVNRGVVQVQGDASRVPIG